MPVEVGVFRRQERHTHVRRDARQRHEVATLDVELAHERAVVGEDARRDRRLVAEKLVDGRQVGRDLPVDDEARHARGQEHRHHAPGEDAPEHACPLGSCHRARSHVTRRAPRNQSRRRHG